MPMTWNRRLFLLQIPSVDLKFFSMANDHLRAYDAPYLSYISSSVVHAEPARYIETVYPVNSVHQLKTLSRSTLSITQCILASTRIHSQINLTSLYEQPKAITNKSETLVRSLRFDMSAIKANRSDLSYVSRSLRLHMYFLQKL